MKVQVCSLRSRLSSQAYDNLQQLVFIPTITKLDSFLAAAKHKKAILSGVESLHIILEQSGVPLTKLRQCLARSKRLTDLELGQHDGIVPLVDFLAALSTTSAAITVLHLPFDPTHHDLLRRVVSATPALVALVLKETPLQNMPRRVSNRRAWNDVIQWARDLRRLPCLNSLALQTSASLVPVPGNVNDERQLVQGWTSSMNIHHPSLRHLTIWYNFGTAHSVLSYWDWEDRVWGRTGSYDNPNFDFFGL
ncbi:hypothetical protein BV22DRAFT_1108277 [Leucogyrophana mollusca]|uniref:Uncharacterized protein n=1 Tax=Leucogyrophana mollusca TaxID=85980 RepID=A0ACB8AZ04_9AGAM|nr:hypothetical protein BV22DRAFT_1108277 [Leucogyrophana mollusca]